MRRKTHHLSGFSFVECCAALLFSAAAAQLFFSSTTTTAKNLQRLRDQQTAGNILQNLYQLNREQLLRLNHQTFDAQGLPSSEHPVFSLTVSHQHQPPLLHLQFQLTFQTPHHQTTILRTHRTLWQEHPL